MQPEFLVASTGIAAIFGLGFLAGYLVRAMISLRRRRAMLAGWPGSVPARAVSKGRRTEMPPESLAGPAVAPSSAGNSDGTNAMPLGERERAPLSTE